MKKSKHKKVVRRTMSTPRDSPSGLDRAIKALQSLRKLLEIAIIDVFLCIALREIIIELLSNNVHQEIVKAFKPFFLT